MEEYSTLRPTTECPECGAVLSENAENCWLCGWMSGDPLSSDAVGGQNGADWTFNLNTLFLWTALIAVVVWILKSCGASGVGPTVGILFSALNTTAIAGHRWRSSGRSLSVPQKVSVFGVSLIICLVLGQLLIVSMTLVFGSDQVPLFDLPAALMVLAFAVVFGIAMFGSMWRNEIGR